MVDHAVSAGGNGELEGMPAPYELHRVRAGNEVAVLWGPRVMFRFSSDDLVMRNLAMVALTDAGAVGLEVAAVFGITPEYLSRIRSKVAEGGSAALVTTRGRPVKLSAAQVNEVSSLADEGVAGTEIARRMGVSQPTISRLLARCRRRQQPPPALDFVQPDEADDADDGSNGTENAGTDGDGTDGPATDGDGTDGPATDGDGDDGHPDGGRVLARLVNSEIRSRYAGAMLLHPFLDRLGAGAILAVLGQSAVPGRYYDPTAIFAAAVMGLSLGEGSLEATKHLARRDAGALVGLERFPECRTLRPRLKDMAAHCDPLGLQVALAKAMLAADEVAPEVFFCDDHFVAYTGAKPVAKGYNIRRHLAEPGRDDTVVVDDRWRAICFDSAEPKGLSVTLPGILARLSEACGGRRVTIGFDRGGSYPKVFAAVADAGMDWVTWRRAPLAAPVADAVDHHIELDGRDVTYRLADETVELAGYGPARQISCWEAERVVFQILTSDATTAAVDLVRLLKARWCIENCFKYLEAHQGLHWMCSYGMDIEPNTAKVANPARRAARQTAADASAALDECRRAMGEVATTPAVSTAEANRKLATLAKSAAAAEVDVAAANTALKAIPAKLPANEIDPDALRARPEPGPRALQTVARLLAYNAELDLARRLDAYLADPDSYRALTRHLLHLGGAITYTPAHISVVLDRPHPPRLAKALGLLIDQINTTPPRLLGDGRAITYTLAPCND